MAKRNRYTNHAGKTELMSVGITKSGFVGMAIPLFLKMTLESAPTVNARRSSRR